MKDNDLIQVRSNVLREYMQDGSLELYAGFVFPILGRMNVENWSLLYDGIGLAIAALAMIGLTVWRKKFTFPRLGYVGFFSWKTGLTKGTRSNLWKAALLGLAGGIVMGLFFVLLRVSGLVERSVAGVDPLLRTKNIWIIAGVWIVVPFLSGYRNFYMSALGVSLFAWVLGCDILHLSDLVAFGVPSLVLIVIGLFRMRKFLREYPRIEEGEAA